VIDYTIISVSDRAAENVGRIREILSQWNELSGNEAVHGLKTNAFKRLNQLGFRFDYRPDDGRTFPMMPTEAGVFASHVLAMINALNNNCDQILIFEDDAIISDDFVEICNLVLSDAPSDWDFISMIAVPEINKYTNDSSIDSAVIHRCLSQPSYLAAVIYSNSGMRKIIQHIKDVGIYYNIDSMIYRASHSRVLNGYILRNEYSYATNHNPSLIKSDIDPENLRNT
jgi:GR25 family glycosyltransferase involved in LPS biosynthesis